MTTILGIETSCDETGIALYNSEQGLIAEALHSQISLHNQYGGVVPELASRDHIRRLVPLLQQCLEQTQISINDIDAIAYTTGPGLNGALLTGAGFANGLAFRLNKPTIPIHHLEGHILSPFLANKKPILPFIALLVSGGHSQLIAVHEIGKYIILGDTLDDAAGEAFDKTAKMLNLPYPGGKYLSELAQYGEDVYKLPRPMIDRNDLHMSFSGLKTAVATLITKLGGIDNINYQTKCNIAKSIEESITDVLVKKSIRALNQTNISQLVISGGVSANTTLRSKLSAISNIEVFYPPLNLCTDNGAMIAIAGYTRYKQRAYSYSFSVSPRYPLTELKAI
ncbi:MAG: tRNA (adenosine(37)-N6)-threonylcarbamoyltransferase complex transferase subunit TsaD [Neisseriaceae bacterium]|jgi:N6-L-threonylcarbamoyladenine synthase